MKYRHFRKILIGWGVFTGLAIILFLAIFFRGQAKTSRRAPSVGLKCEVIKHFSFSAENALKEWEEKIFKNRVTYRIEKEDGRAYVRAISDKAASALYYQIKIDAKTKEPVVTWRWRVEKFPTKTSPESLEIENVDDFAARVYVIFPAMFITNSKVLEYVWSETMPVGTTGTSPYSKNIKLVVLEQGIDKDKKWFTETRDIYSDYVKLFGRAPEYNIGAIAFMTNTEHTQTSADAMYGDIEVGYKVEAGTKEGGGSLEN